MEESHSRPDRYDVSCYDDDRHDSFLRGPKIWIWRLHQELLPGAGGVFAANQDH